MKIRLSYTFLTVAAVIVLAASGSVASAGDRECSAVMAWSKLQMFERGSNGKLMHRTFDPGKKEWSKWGAIAETGITSAPSALMTDGGTRLAVFFRGTDGKLYHVFRDRDTGWSEVIGLGDRELTSGPTAVIVGEQLTVLARGTAGKQMMIYYDRAKGSWSDWSDVE